MAMVHGQRTVDHGQQEVRNDRQSSNGPVNDDVLVVLQLAHVLLMVSVEDVDSEAATVTFAKAV